MKCKLYALFTVLLTVCFVVPKAQTVPTPDHIIVLVMENHGSDQIIGSADAPYINSLATDPYGALFTNSHGMAHPSQPNYLYLFSGSSQNVILDVIPFSFQLPFTSANLGAELLQAGKTFTGYAEDMPYPGYTADTMTTYVRRHCPWIDWQDGTTNGIPAALSQPYTSFPSNFNNLPTISWVIPNLDHDMHNGTVAQGDAWVQANMDAYIQWAKTHNSLLILTFDEDENLTGSNQVTTIFIGQMVKAGQYNENIDHNKVLRTMEDMYGLGYAGGAASSSPITDCWVYRPNANFGTLTRSLCPGETLAFTDSTTNGSTNWVWTFAGGSPAASTAQNPSVTYSTPGNYDVTLVSSNQMGADTLLLHNYVTVQSHPSIQLPSNNVLLCKGDTATITASGAVNYHWFSTPGQIAVNSGVLKASPDTDVVYTVTGDNYGCNGDTVQVSVSVLNKLVPAINILSNTGDTACTGGVVVFTAVDTNVGGAPVYQWRVNGNNVGSNTSSFSAYSFGSGYSVSCIITSSYACARPASAVSNTVSIAVEVPPVASFTALPVNGYQYSFTSTGSGALTYNWDFGDGDSSSLASPAHTYTANGTYTVTLTVSNGVCSDISTQTITVDGLSVFNLSVGGISIFPNPVSTQLNIHAIDNIYQVRITDLVGNTVVLLQLNGKRQYAMDISGLSSGIYFINIQCGNKTYAGKILKQ